MATPSQSRPSDDRPQAWLAALLLVLVTVAVYGRTVTFGFTNFDDPEYVVDNPQVRDGLTMEGLWWAFTTTHQANWHPLTWLSLMLDAELSGTRPAMFRLTNLALHLANTLLLFFALDRMTRSQARSAVVAALFAVHPLHVESVAWIAERKDVLSTLFWFWTFHAWLGYLRTPNRRRYGAVILLFALGLLAKPMLVTLPLVLLLLDLWPLRRGPRIAEKLPLFVLSLLSGTVTLYAQHRGGALGTVETYPLVARIENALVATTTYVGKALVPRRLAALYPHPGTTIPASTVALSAALLAAFTVCVLAARKTRPYLAVGWLWFLLTLLPVIGIVQVGAQSMADRYTYVPLVGVFLAVAWGIGDCVPARAKRLRRAISAAAVVWVGSLAALAFVQAGYWRDGVTLFERTIALTRKNSMAENNLGAAYYKRDGPGDLERSVTHYSEAVRLNPNYAVALNNLAGALAKLGRTEEAIARWRDAVRAKRDHVPALCNLAGALIKTGNLEEGIRRCSEALRVEPEAACAHYNLGMALLRKGDLEGAGDHLAATVRVEPRSTDSLLNLGVVRTRQGRLDEAIDLFTRVLRIDPSHEGARHNLERARQRKTGGAP